MIGGGEKSCEAVCAVAVTLDWFTLKSAGSHYALSTDLYSAVLSLLNSLKLNVHSLPTNKA